MYRLTLTKEERNAIDWIGFRYWCGSDLRRILCKGNTEHTEIGWGSGGDVTFELPEHLAWDILEIAREECGDEIYCPCLGEVLTDKLLGFIYNIV